MELTTKATWQPTKETLSRATANIETGDFNGTTVKLVCPNDKILKCVLNIAQ